MLEKPTYSFSTSDLNRSYSYLLPILKKLLIKIQDNNLNNKLKVLDIGCGNGAFCSFLQELGFEVVGIDPSEVGINIARNNSPEIIFHNISIYDFEQKELYGKFDIITSIEVIEHLNYVSVFLKQVKKYLRPDGYFLLTTPYHGYIKNLVLSVFNLWDRHFSVRNEVGHLRFFSVKSLSGMLKDAGLSNIKLYFSGRCLYLWKSMICLCQNKA